MAGYVKLHRSVRGTAIADKPEYFAAWVHLLCMATYREHTQVVGRKTVTLEPGQLVFGRTKFSLETGISENKVRAALDVMRNLGMITSKSHGKFSVISIVNWSQYQEESPENHQQTASKSPANSHKQEGARRNKKEQEKPPKPPKGDGVPLDEIIDLYHRMLPELPQAANYTDTRVKQIKARWNETATVPVGNGEFEKMPCSSMDFWERYFRRVRTCPLLMGKKNGWHASLDWLTKKANFYKVIEGNYVE